jgi:hypothetical protein
MAPRRRPSPPLHVGPAPGATGTPAFGSLTGTFGPQPQLVQSGIARELLRLAPQAVPGLPGDGVHAQAAGGLIRDRNVGQSAGPPGMGQEPQLVHEPGGAILHQLQHPAFQRVAQLYKVLPEDSWFDPLVGPENPVQFQMGAFQVPDGMQYWLFEYDFAAWRQSGVDPADSIVAEEGRFGTVLGFDLTVDGWRTGNLLYQLNPVPVQLQKTQYQPQAGRAARIDPFAFDVAAAESFASSAGPGLSLLPPGTNTQSPTDLPFTIIANEGQWVAFSAVIFETVDAPLTGLSAFHSGYLISTNVATSLIQRLRVR